MLHVEEEFRRARAVPDDVRMELIEVRIEGGRGVLRFINVVVPAVVGIAILFDEFVDVADDIPRGLGHVAGRVGAAEVDQAVLRELDRIGVFLPFLAVEAVLADCGVVAERGGHDYGFRGVRRGGCGRKRSIRRDLVDVFDIVDRDHGIVAFGVRAAEVHRAVLMEDDAFGLKHTPGLAVEAVFLLDGVVAERGEDQDVVVCEFGDGRVGHRGRRTDVEFRHFIRGDIGHVARGVRAAEPDGTEIREEDRPFVHLPFFAITAVFLLDGVVAEYGVDVKALSGRQDGGGHGHDRSGRRNFVDVRHIEGGQVGNVARRIDAAEIEVVVVREHDAGFRIVRPVLAPVIRILAHDGIFAEPRKDRHVLIRRIVDIRIGERSVRGDLVDVFDDEGGDGGFSAVGIQAAEEDYAVFIEHDATRVGLPILPVHGELVEGGALGERGGNRHVLIRRIGDIRAGDRGIRAENEAFHFVFGHVGRVARGVRAAEVHRRADLSDRDRFDVGLPFLPVEAVFLREGIIAELGGDENAFKAFRGAHGSDRGRRRSLVDVRNGKFGQCGIVARRVFGAEADRVVGAEHDAIIGIFVPVFIVFAGERVCAHDGILAVRREDGHVLVGQLVGVRVGERSFRRDLVDVGHFEGRDRRTVAFVVQAAEVDGAVFVKPDVVRVVFPGPAVPRELVERGFRIERGNDRHILIRRGGNVRFRDRGGRADGETVHGEIRDIGRVARGVRTAEEHRRTDFPNRDRILIGRPFLSVEAVFLLDGIFAEQGGDEDAFEGFRGGHGSDRSRRRDLVDVRHLEYGQVGNVARRIDAAEVEVVVVREHDAVFRIIRPALAPVIRILANDGVVAERGCHDHILIRGLGGTGGRDRSFRRNSVDIRNFERRDSGHVAFRIGCTEVDCAVVIKNDRFFVRLPGPPVAAEFLHRGELVKDGGHRHIAVRGFGNVRGCDRFRNIGGVVDDRRFGHVARVVDGLNRPAPVGRIDGDGGRGCIRAGGHDPVFADGRGHAVRGIGRGLGRSGGGEVKIEMRVRSFDGNDVLGTVFPVLHDILPDAGVIVGGFGPAEREGDGPVFVFGGPGLEARRRGRGGLVDVAHTEARDVGHDTVGIRAAEVIGAVLMGNEGDERGVVIVAEGRRTVAGGIIIQSARILIMFGAVTFRLIIPDELVTIICMGDIGPFFTVGHTAAGAAGLAAGHIAGDGRIIAAGHIAGDGRIIAAGGGPIIAAGHIAAGHIAAGHIAGDGRIIAAGDGRDRDPGLSVEAVFSRGCRRTEVDGQADVRSGERRNVGGDGRGSQPAGRSIFGSNCKTKVVSGRTVFGFDLVHPHREFVAERRHTAVGIKDELILPLIGRRNLAFVIVLRLDRFIGVDTLVGPFEIAVLRAVVTDQVEVRVFTEERVLRQDISAIGLCPADRDRVLRVVIEGIEHLARVRARLVEGGRIGDVEVDDAAVVDGNSGAVFEPHPAGEFAAGRNGDHAVAAHIDIADHTALFDKETAAPVKRVGIPAVKGLNRGQSQRGLFQDGPAFHRDGDLGERVADALRVGPEFDASVRIETGIGEHRAGVDRQVVPVRAADRGRMVAGEDSVFHGERDAVERGVRDLCVVGDPQLDAVPVSEPGAVDQHGAVDIDASGVVGPLGVADRVEIRNDGSVIDGDVVMVVHASGDGVEILHHAAAEHQQFAVAHDIVDGARVLVNRDLPFQPVVGERVRGERIGDGLRDVVAPAEHDRAAIFHHVQGGGSVVGGNERAHVRGEVRHGARADRNGNARVISVRRGPHDFDIRAAEGSIGEAAALQVNGDAAGRALQDRGRRDLHMQEGLGIHIEIGDRCARQDVHIGSAGAFGNDDLFLFIFIGAPSAAEILIFDRGHDGSFDAVGDRASGEVDVGPAEDHRAGERAATERGAAVGLGDIGRDSAAHVGQISVFQGGVLQFSVGCRERHAVDRAVDDGTGGDLEIQIRPVFGAFLRLRDKSVDDAAREDGQVADSGNGLSAGDCGDDILPFLRLFVENGIPDRAFKGTVVGVGRGRVAVHDAAAVDGQAAFDRGDIDRRGAGVDRAVLVIRVDQAPERVGQERDRIRHAVGLDIADVFIIGFNIPGTDHDRAAVFPHDRADAAEVAIIASPVESGAEPAAGIHGNTGRVDFVFHVHGAARVDVDGVDPGAGRSGKGSARIDRDVFRDRAAVHVQNDVTASDRGAVECGGIPDTHRGIILWCGNDEFVYNDLAAIDFNISFIQYGHIVRCAVIDTEAAAAAHDRIVERFCIGHDCAAVLHGGAVHIDTGLGAEYGAAFQCGAFDQDEIARCEKRAAAHHGVDGSAFARINFHIAAGHRGVDGRTAGQDK